MSEVKQEVKDLSEKIKKEIKIDTKTGIATISETLYKDNLPEGMTIDNVKAVQDYNSRIVAATGLALGEASIPVMKKHKELEFTELTLPIVKDTASFTFDRQSTSRNPTDGSEVIKHGALSVKYVTSGAGTSKGELKKVRAHLFESAAAALAGK